MNTYTHFLSSSRIYAFVWRKYRPAILKLMVDSSETPQQYQFSKHEIKGINPKERGGHTFSLQVRNGKAVNNIRTSAIAQDLLLVLQQSKKASELVDLATYEFKLDKHFVLHITKQPEPEVIVADEVAS
jgi:hypothetical protein